MTDQMPLVSCIMPTANRGNFIPRAIEYYQRQDYPNKELVIVDDGIVPIGDLLPAGISVRYERLSNVLQTGAKRNYACDIATGDIIVHWDDDDWYAPGWITHQVNTLLTSQVDICGLSQLYFYAPHLMKSWIYAYPVHDRPWVAGASMAYFKKFWEVHPFRDIKIGEDNNFVWDSGARVVAHGYREGLVALIHSQNTSPKHTNNHRWKPLPNQVIENILKKDYPWYTGNMMR